MSEHSFWVRGFLVNTWEISLRCHKCGSVYFLNRLRIWAHTNFDHPSTAHRKLGKNGFHSKHICKEIVTCLPDWLHPNQIPKSYPAHRRRTLDFIFSGSEVTEQTMLRVPITLWPIASRHFAQHKKCDDFLASWCRKLFKDISLNDLDAIVFSHYYSPALKEQICAERWKDPFPTRSKVSFSCIQGSLL